MNKLEIQRKFPDHFKALGYDLPDDTSAKNTRWHQPVLHCDHEFCFLTLADIVNDVLKNMVELVPSQSCTMYVYDKRSRMLLTKASTNSKRQLDVKFSPAMGIAGRCFSRKAAIHVEKPGQNSLFEAKSDGRDNKSAESILCVPLVVDDKAIGLFQLVNRVAEKRDKFVDLDRYMEGFNNLKLNAEHLGESTNENAFRARDIDTLVDYAALVAGSIHYSLRKLDEADPTFDRGSSAMDLLNMLNGKIHGSPSFDSMPPVLERQASIPLPEAAPARPREPSTKQMLRGNTNRKSRPIIIPRAPTNIKERLVKAAIKCQAWGRGWLVRKQHLLERLRIQKAAQHELRHTRALHIQRTFRGMVGRTRTKRIRTAIKVVGYAVLNYAQRNKAPGERKTVGSPRTRKMWAQTSTRLLSDNGKAKARKATNIQKVFRGHKARSEIKQEFGASNPAKVFRSFIKLQARFKGRLVRKLIEKHTILHATAQKTTPPPFAIVRMVRHHRSNNEVPPLQRPAYPRCHIGVNPYLVLRRGQLPDLVPLFDTLRINQENWSSPKASAHTRQSPRRGTVPAMPLSPLDGLCSRRLVAAAETPHQLPNLVARSGAQTPGKGQDKRPSNAFRLDARRPHRTRTWRDVKSMSQSVDIDRVLKASQPPASSNPSPSHGLYNETHYPIFRTQVFFTAVGAPPKMSRATKHHEVAAHRRLDLQTKQTPFLCLVHHTEDAKREGIRKALEELKQYYQNRVVVGPISRRKSIKEVMDECRHLVGTQSVLQLVHRVKTSRGIDLDAPLLHPETLNEEASVGEMDSVDSLALDYRPVTPMLAAIELVPPSHALQRTDVDDL
ncbi:Aste57867_21309 [Aphanomyces stellatus]|uniref:Aste57867_21309 protein n=1 Tax=Aphanomyces stellatus TaxID=120398 RepID=A0A485LHS8_9STRA|nr:hypothetical protein As57867_021240 [Aphanomyces stellatus]VFT97981.1 Aste57867_21309 [Aphanomyces stellatus]